jgi:hypothetical protein
LFLVLSNEYRGSVAVASGLRHAYCVPLASHPHERTDAIGIYLGHQGEGARALAFGPSSAAPGGGRAGKIFQRVTSSVLRGGLTSWVHIGMLVRRMRGRTDPLQGLGQRDTFRALCRLTQAAIEAEAVPGSVSGGLEVANHVQLFTTMLDADITLERIERVLGPYAAAGTVTRTGRAVIAWFAIRHLIATRSRDYSLQVVHFTPDSGWGGQVSLMLPRDMQEESVQAPGAPSGTVTYAGDAPARRRPRHRPRAVGSSAAPAVDVAGLQAYLDAYRDHLTRELLLEPFVSGSASEFEWAPEPTGDGGVAVAGIVPGVVADHVVLRMAEDAMVRLGERSPGSGGTRLGGLERDGTLLIQRWAVGVGGGYVLSVAARSGDRRHPTQVLIHFAVAMPADDGTGGSWDGGQEDDAPALAPARHQPPMTGPAAAEAATLTNLPLWWHDAGSRVDGEDLIIYEMPFRGRRLRVRANDYPAEPMYTLLVGEPGEETAAVDLEDWPSSWTRPRSY